MNFCPNCGYMLYPTLHSREGIDHLYHTCRFCGYEKEHDSSEPFVISSSTQQSSNHDLIESGIVNEFTKLNPTYARTNKIPCVNPDCTTNAPSLNATDEDSLHMRSVIPFCANPTSLKYIFICCTCDYVWSMEE